MLSDREIIAINKQNANQPLRPFVFESKGSPSYGLSSHGYDIRLSDEIKVSKRMTGYHSVLNPVAKHFHTDLEAAFATYKNIVSYDMKPGEFVLAASMEVFDIPNDISMELKDKSTWARLGLQLFNTITEAGFVGRLVLELYNNSQNTIVLTPGVGIGQAVFHRLSSPCLKTYADRQGKYQGQGLGADKVTHAR